MTDYLDAFPLHPNTDDLNFTINADFILDTRCESALFDEQWRAALVSTTVQPATPLRGDSEVLEHEIFSTPTSLDAESYTFTFTNPANDAPTALSTTPGLSATTSSTASPFTSLNTPADSKPAWLEAAIASWQDPMPVDIPETEADPEEIDALFKNFIHTSQVLSEPSTQQLVSERAEVDQMSTQASSAPLNTSTIEHDTSSANHCSVDSSISSHPEIENRPEDETFVVPTASQSQNLSFLPGPNTQPFAMNAVLPTPSNNPKPSVPGSFWSKMVSVLLCPVLACRKEFCSEADLREHMKDHTTPFSFGYRSSLDKENRRCERRCHPIQKTSRPGRVLHEVANTNPSTSSYFGDDDIRANSRIVEANNHEIVPVPPASSNACPSLQDPPAFGSSGCHAVGDTRFVLEITVSPADIFDPELKTLNSVSLPSDMSLPPTEVEVEIPQTETAAQQSRSRSLTPGHEETGAASQALATSIRDFAQVEDEAQSQHPTRPAKRRRLMTPSNASPTQVSSQHKRATDNSRSILTLNGTERFREKVAERSSETPHQDRRPPQYLSGRSSSRRPRYYESDMDVDEDSDDEDFIDNDRDGDFYEPPRKLQKKGNNVPDKRKESSSRQRTQKGIKKYPCPIAGCRQSFVRQCDLRRHERDVPHGKDTGEGYRCTRCSKVLSRADALKRHLDKDACGKRK